MKVSLNELETRYARAFEAMGCPAGLAQDAARIVAKHDIWGLGGLTALADRLPRLDGVPPPRPRVDKGSDPVAVDAQGGSLLFAGPQVLDLLEVEAARNDSRTMRLDNCADRDFLPGLAGLAAQRGLPLQLDTDLDSEHVAGTVVDGHVWLRRAGPQARRDNSVAFRLITPERPTAAARSSDLDAERIDALERQAIEQGVALDDDLWHHIHALGARFLVAETEQSRQHGAGGGSDAD